MKLRTLAKTVPVVSYLVYAGDFAHNKSEPLSLRLTKLIGHAVYGFSAIAYVLGIYYHDMGNPNPIQWKEIYAKRQESRQQYATLLNKAIDLADNDGIKGLSFHELDDLCRRAETSPNVVKFPNGDIKFPDFTREGLERAVESYEIERKK